MWVLPAVDFDRMGLVQVIASHARWEQINRILYARRVDLPEHSYSHGQVGGRSEKFDRLFDPPEYSERMRASTFRQT